jgi:dienelactone hydrolase
MRNTNLIRRLIPLVLVGVILLLAIAPGKDVAAKTASPVNVIESSLKLLERKGIPGNHEGVLILKRYRYYLAEIAKGNGFADYHPGATPPVYDYLAFANMMSKDTWDIIVGNTLSGNDPFRGISGFFERAYLSETDQTLDSYLIYLPKSYDSEKLYPLMVFLHGYGESVYLPQFSAVHNGFLEACENNQVIMVAPNGKHKLPSVSNYMNEGEKDILQVIKLVRKIYNVDVNRIYLTGLSMGGFGTWYIGSRHPEMFAALAPVCGYGTGQWYSAAVEIDRLKNVPVMTFHGDMDDTVPVGETRTLVKQMQDKGYPVIYHELPGVKHNAWDYAYQGDTLVKWFLKNTKQ